MQQDGNVVVYNNSKPIWASNTMNKGKGPYKLYMQGDGNLVAYGVSGAIWATNTNKGTGPYVAKLDDNCKFALYDSIKAELWNSTTPPPAAAAPPPPPPPRNNKPMACGKHKKCK